METCFLLSLKVIDLSEESAVFPAAPEVSPV